MSEEITPFVKAGGMKVLSQFTQSHHVTELRVDSTDSDEFYVDVSFNVQNEAEANVLESVLQPNTHRQVSTSVESDSMDVSGISMSSISSGMLFSPLPDDGCEDFCSTFRGNKKHALTSNRLSTKDSNVGASASEPSPETDVITSDSSTSMELAGSTVSIPSRTSKDTRSSLSERTVADSPTSMLLKELTEDTLKTISVGNTEKQAKDTDSEIKGSPQLSSLSSARRIPTMCTHQDYCKDCSTFHESSLKSLSSYTASKRFSKDSSSSTTIESPPRKAKHLDNGSTLSDIRSIISRLATEVNESESNDSDTDTIQPQRCTSASAKNHNSLENNNRAQYCAPDDAVCPKHTHVSEVLNISSRSLADCGYVESGHILRYTNPSPRRRLQTRFEQEVRQQIIDESDKPVKGPFPPFQLPAVRERLVRMDRGEPPSAKEMLDDAPSNSSLLSSTVSDRNSSGHLVRVETGQLPKVAEMDDKTSGNSALLSTVKGENKNKITHIDDISATSVISEEQEDEVVGCVPLPSNPLRGVMQSLKKSISRDREHGIRLDVNTNFNGLVDDYFEEQERHENASYLQKLFERETEVDLKSLPNGTNSSLGRNSVEQTLNRMIRSKRESQLGTAESLGRRRSSLFRRTSGAAMGFFRNKPSQQAQTRDE